jgi:hypothetical protein
VPKPELLPHATAPEVPEVPKHELPPLPEPESHYPVPEAKP